MIEIRPIRQLEADTFLQLLCTVFDIDFHRAKTVFFAEPSFDLSRKWALFDAGRMVSILTTTPIQIGAHSAVGIAGVATDASEQRKGFARQLIEYVINKSRENGEEHLYLFARDESLYSRVGFETVDTVVEGFLEASPDFRDCEIVPPQKVRAIYNEWALQEPNRLIRTQVRWGVWDWACRVCETAKGGYICYEATTVREAIVTLSENPWPVTPGTDWLGLSHTTKVLGIPVETKPTDLFLMATSGAPLPVMFMTDQF